MALADKGMKKSKAPIREVPKVDLFVTMKLDCFEEPKPHNLADKITIGGVEWRRLSGDLFKRLYVALLCAMDRQDITGDEREEVRDSMERMAGIYDRLCDIYGPENIRKMARECDKKHDKMRKEKREQQTWNTEGM
jgi:hypothetical protein